MAKIIDGKALAAHVKARCAAGAQGLARRPGLAVILVGDDPASRVYVNNKKKACANAGIYSEEFALPADTTQDELLALVASLNGRSDINGILCQLPLPAHIDDKAVIAAISPMKDVDAFHAANVGHIMIGAEMVGERTRQIPGFPVKLGNELKHCILAHHGELEYGSPKKPALLEAIALNFADNTDAHMQTMIEALKAAGDNQGWLGYNRLFESNIRKTSK